MQFEHVVIVAEDAPTQAFAATRRSLCEGLRLLAYRPQAFDAGIDHSEVEIRGRDELARRLRRGRQVISDQVSLLDGGQRLQQRILGPPQVAGVTREVSVESPEEGYLLLRFRYAGPARPLTPSLPDEEATALRSAYLGADRDFVMALRRFHEQGSLPQLLALHVPALV
jgi:hypothetical protein